MNYFAAVMQHIETFNFAPLSVELRGELVHISYQTGNRQSCVVIPRTPKQYYVDGWMYCHDSMRTGISADPELGAPQLLRELGLSHAEVIESMPVATKLLEWLFTEFQKGGLLVQTATSDEHLKYEIAIPQKAWPLGFLVISHGEYRFYDLANKCLARAFSYKVSAQDITCWIEQNCPDNAYKSALCAELAVILQKQKQLSYEAE